MLHVQQADCRPEVISTATTLDDVLDDVLDEFEDEYETSSEQVARLCEDILDNEYVGNWLTTEVKRISSNVQQWRQQRQHMLLTVEQVDIELDSSRQLRLRKAALSHIKSVREELLRAQAQCANLNRENWPRLTFKQVSQ